MKLTRFVPLIALLLATFVHAEAPEKWTRLLDAQEVHARLQEPGTVFIDARSPEEYAAGHLPGAINLPGKALRTPSAKPGQGDSQYFFRDANGEVDVAKYAALLSQAGIRNDHRVIVYGNHAGQADGSVPALILDALGHQEVAFFDGIGPSEWISAGYEVETKANTLPPSQYVPQPREGYIWNLDDVLAHLGDEKVAFYDTRSPGEFAGTDLRGNARGGHIPGAIALDYAAFLNEDKTTKSPAEVQALVEGAGLTPDQTLVLYCQTATRVSLPVLVLRDLGFDNIAVYDASWHEYGNREDTPIEQ